MTDTRYDHDPEWILEVRRWLQLDKKRFGDTKQIDQTVTINLGDAMREAQERLDRSRTVDVPVRRIG